MNFARLLLVPVLAVASLACSCMGNVVLANPTDHAVTVFVTPQRKDSTTKWCDCPHGYDLRVYAVGNAADPKALQHATWAPVDSSAFHWDTSGRAPKLTVAVTLPAGSTLSLGSAAFDCSGGVIGDEMPALVEIVDGQRQLRFDPIALGDHRRKDTRFLVMYEIPPSTPSPAP